MTSRNDKMSRRLSWLSVTMIFLVTGAARAEDVLSQDVVDRVETVVRDSLKDPDSATFKDIAALTVSPGKMEICGFVNAKNGFGGYVGFKGFFVTVDQGQAELVGIMSDSWSSDDEARQLLRVSQGCQKVLLAKIKNGITELKTE